MTGPDVKNHRWISLARIALKLSTGIDLSWLLSSREEYTHENQARRGCIDHFFVRQAFEHKHIFRDLSWSLFLDLKAAFVSVSRSISRHCLLPKCLIDNFTSLYWGWICSYSHSFRDFLCCSPEFSSSTISQFSTINIITEMTLVSSGNGDRQVFPQTGICLC